MSIVSPQRNELTYPTMHSDSEPKHALLIPWTFHYSHRSVNEKITNYEDAIKKLATVDTVEGFWQVYSYLKRPLDISPISDFHVFREGIRPMWEDPENMQGGKWMIRLKKGLATRLWENLLLGLIGGQFQDPINGVVLSIRVNEDIISVWNASAANGAVNLRIRDTIKFLLNLPEQAVLEYKEHNESLKDKSSFRNTDIFM